MSGYITSLADDDIDLSLFQLQFSYPDADLNHDMTSSE